MRLLLLLAIGCGGLADSAQVQDIAQALEPALPRGWCCADELGGVAILVCGDSARSVEPGTCHCNGSVSPEGACHDETPFTPGTRCMGGERVCW